ncbi:hypothetical protein [Paracoccus onubensis]|uniref:hypothetical protein n=1 Tax=Paracoccus onubensis TaxID=1675788 RepID=UPI0016011666|nr:hypothetical protein [Paracoccus onubensis]
MQGIFILHVACSLWFFALSGRGSYCRGNPGEGRDHIGDRVGFPQILGGGGRSVRQGEQIIAGIRRQLKKLIRERHVFARHR